VVTGTGMAVGNGVEVVTGGVGPGAAEYGGGGFPAAGCSHCVLPVAV
jgi:hypothetical protein